MSQIAVNQNLGTEKMEGQNKKSRFAGMGLPSSKNGKTFFRVLPDPLKDRTVLVRPNADPKKYVRIVKRKQFFAFGDSYTHMFMHAENVIHMKFKGKTLKGLSKTEDPDRKIISNWVNFFPDIELIFCAGQVDLNFVRYYKLAHKEDPYPPETMRNYIRWLGSFQNRKIHVIGILASPIKRENIIHVLLKYHILEQPIDEELILEEYDRSQKQLKVWNDILKEECQKHEIHYIDIFQEMEEIPERFIDQNPKTIHLRYLPCLEEIKKRIPDLQINFQKAWKIEEEYVAEKTQRHLEILSRKEVMEIESDTNSQQQEETPSLSGNSSYADRKSSVNDEFGDEASQFQVDCLQKKNQSHDSKQAKSATESQTEITLNPKTEIKLYYDATKEVKKESENTHPSVIQFFNSKLQASSEEKGEVKPTPQYFLPVPVINEKKESKFSKMIFQDKKLNGEKIDRPLHQMTDIRKVFENYLSEKMATYVNVNTEKDSDFKQEIIKMITKDVKQCEKLVVALLDTVVNRCYNHSFEQVPKEELWRFSTKQKICLNLIMYLCQISSSEFNSEVKKANPFKIQLIETVQSKFENLISPQPRGQLVELSKFIAELINLKVLNKKVAHTIVSQLICETVQSEPKARFYCIQSILLFGITLEKHSKILKLIQFSEQLFEKQLQIAKDLDTFQKSEIQKFYTEEKICTYSFAEYHQLIELLAEHQIKVHSQNSESEGIKLCLKKFKSIFQ